MNLPRIQPIAPKRIQAPFDHPEFVYELKMDGWRCLAYIENGVCRLISRKENQYKSFSPLNAALAKLPVQNAIIDGEVVCLDAKGNLTTGRSYCRRRVDTCHCVDFVNQMRTIGTWSKLSLTWTPRQFSAPALHPERRRLRKNKQQNRSDILVQVSQDWRWLSV